MVLIKGIRAAAGILTGWAPQRFGRLARSRGCTGAGASDGPFWRCDGRRGVVAAGIATARGTGRVTALHIATRRGLKQPMAERVACGADVNRKDPDGLTALDYAMARGWLTYLTTRPPPRMDLAKLLRDLGATVELDKVPNWPGEFPPIGPPRQHESEIWPL